VELLAKRGLFETRHISEIGMTYIGQFNNFLFLIKIKLNGFKKNAITLDIINRLKEETILRIVEYV
jgi:hypothetical protein